MTEDLKRLILDRFEARATEWDGPREGMSPLQWHRAWVRVMLDVAAEVLAEKISETKPPDEN